MVMIYDLAIIGGGPAGVAAGVYAARKKIVPERREVSLVCKERERGLVRAHDMHRG
jgi:thioredoxin reductase